MNYDEFKSGESNGINTDYEYYKSENKKKSPIITIDVHSQVFMIIAIVMAVSGIVTGVVLGIAIPTIYDEFNWTLMFGVWITFAVTAIGFWAIYCHLNNQEETLIELKRINHKLSNDE